MTTDNVTRGENVIWRQIDDEIVVVSDDGQTLCTLNKTATLVWLMLDGTRDIEAITTDICERFNISFKDAYNDVSIIIDGFVQTGIASKSE